MPYLTPETLPTEKQCRRLLIPDSPEWLAIVSGALTELTLSWNWQQKGITVAEALEAAQAIIFSYYNQPCTDPESCVTEEGTRIIRLLPGGLYEELINSTWQTPEGDLEIEPTPARSEPSELDRLCLASKNAANVLKLLYEEVTDEFDEVGAIAPVIAAMLAGIAALVAAFVSAAAAAFVVLGATAVEDFFQLLAIVSFDLWTEEFEHMLYCIFLANASSAGSVVHFDYDAITEELHDEVSGTSLDIQRKQLCLQVLYLLNIIAKPGLEWAGTTTAITDDDCDDCDVWQHCLLGGTLDTEFLTPVSSTDGIYSFGAATYSPGSDWYVGQLYSGSGNGSGAAINLDLNGSHITKIVVNYTVQAPASSSEGPRFTAIKNSSGTNLAAQNTPNAGAYALTYNLNDTDGDTYQIWSSGRRTNPVLVTAITITGEGINPFTTGSNCP